MTDHDRSDRRPAPACAPPGSPPAAPQPYPSGSAAWWDPSPQPPRASTTAADPSGAAGRPVVRAEERGSSPDGLVDRTSADRSPPQRIWCESHPRLQALSVWTERVPGRGEDAEPFVAHHSLSLQGLLSVFDGSGGAGAAPVWQAPDGTSRTSAWVGARVARLATDCWFREVSTGGEPATPETLHEYLQYFLASAPQRRSKISGTMRRQLPTTLAAVHYRVLDAQGGLELQPLWAGDSRAYVLGEEAGLQVLTRDHTQESDALELLRTDPPMTNLVCADREFAIDSQRLRYQMPCVLVVATDGFFGYVHTPPDFECLLLSTLQQAHNEGEWADLIRREVQSYTADDASLAVLALGYSTFEELRDRFGPRYRELTDRYVHSRPRGLDRPAAASEGVAAPAPAPEDPARLPARVRDWQDTTWHTYRAGYEMHLPPAPEERA
ncbi:serine/threonine protein phosphatase [Streptomyces sp. CA-288835]|uniref:serine/threonine protein phosphatase n=1 Tax=Streptomyces sp. CA-288835 TaxID=3240069 RepID=UPI003D9444B8